jgi:MazG family protein
MEPTHPITLRAIMDRLRAPDGCPWDREQNHKTLSKSLREETAEVLEAIAEHVPNEPESETHLCEELGDLWLQVAFHARLAEERGAFDIHDVEAMVVEKLLRRHPHIFGDAIAGNSDQVLTNWQAIKRLERKNRGQEESGLLEKIPASLSSIDEAVEIGRKCAQVGFDWPDVGGVLEKVKEEIAELTAENSQDRVEEEFGDVLFSLIQWARYKKIDPDIALRQQMARFKQRFKYVETCANEAGGWENISLDQMEVAWESAKLQLGDQNV